MNDQPAAFNARHRPSFNYQNAYRAASGSECGKSQQGLARTSRYQRSNVRKRQCLPGGQRHEKCVSEMIVVKCGTPALIRFPTESSCDLIATTKQGSRDLSHRYPGNLLFRWSLSQLGELQRRPRCRPVDACWLLCQDTGNLIGV